MEGDGQPRLCLGTASKILANRRPSRCSLLPNLIHDATNQGSVARRSGHHDDRRLVDRHRQALQQTTEGSSAQRRPISRERCG